MFRKYSKKKELKRLTGVTRFATPFLTLKSIDESKLALRAMLALEEWARCPYSSKMEAKKVEVILLLDDKFWKSIKHYLKCASPLIKVLRLVDGDANPAMGYVYEAKDRAKEQIA
ncbi:Ribonuclease H-like protein [Dioscorea alata]|uniref:Ribonuclease H-like protein n=1 Tax=Dioscorea alata TaxID=55571 RepID=A0ACB7WQ07_DIOAL|nr:Ribonuclease H-like protein [Dioscorea alata]